jgi:RND superfamily putative drug exporter
VACLGILGLNTGNIQTADQFTKTTDSTVGQQLLVDHGLVDSSTPIQVVTNESAADAVVAAVKTVPGIGDVNTNIPAVGGVKYIEVTQGFEPASPDAADQVKAVRAAVHPVPNANALVGGSAAIFLDTANASHRDDLVIVPLILLVVLLILLVLLRAVLSPVILMLTVVLSYGAALGISTLIFKYIYGYDMADSSFPLFVFVFLVALGIDYNIFLMTRVREETMTKGTRTGSLVALASTGGVITSAGLVLAATFAVLGTLPVVFLAELATAVALGVLLDTLVVRSVLVTAINLDLGGRIWWPSSLDRAPAVEPVSAPASEVV